MDTGIWLDWALVCRRKGKEEGGSFAGSEGGGGRVYICCLVITITTSCCAPFSCRKMQKDTPVWAAGRAFVREVVKRFICSSRYVEEVHCLFARSLVTYKFKCYSHSPRGIRGCVCVRNRTSGRGGKEVHDYYIMGFFPLFSFPR